MLNDFKNCRGSVTLRNSSVEMSANEFMFTIKASTATAYQLTARAVSMAIHTRSDMIRLQKQWSGLRIFKRELKLPIQVSLSTNESCSYCPLTRVVCKVFSFCLKKLVM